MNADYACKISRRNFRCLKNKFHNTSGVSYIYLTRSVYLCGDSSASRRLECAAAAEKDRSCRSTGGRRKDASDEAQLWSSMQSLADDEDLIDSLSRSAAAAPSARLVLPAQFRRPTPPSVCSLHLTTAVYRLRQ